MPCEPPRRLFFALWPPAQAVDQIMALSEQLAGIGKLTPPDKLHVTLAFHGSCNAAQYSHLMARAAQLNWPPIELPFDRLGSFQRPRVVWLGMSRPSGLLSGLAAALGQDSTTGDLEANHFVPHITLGRRGSRMHTDLIAPIAWQAREFTLVESGAHGRPGAYHILGRWHLTGADVK